MRKFFEKMSVAKKNRFLFGVVIGTTTFSMIILYILLISSNSTMQRTTEQDVHDIQDELELSNSINDLNVNIMSLILSDSSTERQAKVTQINEIKANIQSYLDKDVGQGENDKEINIKANLEKTISLSDQIVEYATNDKLIQANSTFNDQMLPNTLSLSTNISELSDISIGDYSTDYGNYQGTFRNTLILFACLAGLSLILTAVIMKAYSSSIIDPLKKLVNACKVLAKGQEISHLNITSNDEFGILSQAFEKMSGNVSFVIKDTATMLDAAAKKNLGAYSSDESRYVGRYNDLVTNTYSVLSQISDNMKTTNEIADQVSSGSNQISSVSQTLAQGTAEQASAIEELSSTVSNISDLSIQNAEQAKQANQESVEVSDNVSESNSYMEQMVRSMEEITSTSTEIGKIVKAIDDIAFQTNILALNAAVEAARAGDSGKGFAVVADEVRNLAQRSADAAKTTTQLVESTVDAISKGTRIANATASSLGKVATSAASINKVINNIAEASENQAEATSQVLTGIDQVSTVVQTNSATAEESAAAAEELAAQAKILTEMTGSYILRNMEANTNIK